jgi:hypothetical protein
MVERKLRQHYRNTPYAAAWLQGRDSGKRKDDRYLFSALTNPDLVAGWLQAINARGLPVAGLFLLPMVSASLPERLQLKATNLLLAAQHASGLRLTFFRDRQFRLSRLTRGDSAKSADPGRLFADEISNTRLYLHALRTATLDEHLSVLLLDRNDELSEVAQVIARDNPSLECVRLGRAELAARLGFAPALLDVSPDVPYLQLLGLRMPESNLAPASVTAGYARHQMRRGLYAACACAAAIGIAWTGYNLWQMVSLDGQAAEAARQTALQQAQYQEVTRQFPAAPTGAENLKRAVELAQKLREGIKTPQTLMAIASRALEASPEVYVRQFGWKYGTTEIESGTGAARPAAELAAAPAAPGVALPRRQTGFIEGEIRPFRGDYRAAIDAINRFAALLGKDPAVLEVRVDKLPLNVNPSLALSGNTLDSREQAGAAEFKLVIALKPGV